jgi:excisionase family DNA binding protein
MDANPQINSQLLTPARLAWVMGVSHSTIDEWVRRREIASFKKGKLRRFEPGAVLEFICRHTVKEKFAQRSLVATLTNADWARIERLIQAELRDIKAINSLPPAQQRDAA